MNKHEEGFAKFLADHQARRILALLDGGKKGRSKLIEMLPHMIVLNKDMAFHIPPSKQFPEPILEILVKHHAPAMCFVVSEDIKLDAQNMPLSDALSACVGNGYGTFISCIPGKLGYYEFEDKNERYILRSQ